MKLETYRWEKPMEPKPKMGRPPLPHCEYCTSPESCESCPYPDCIATEKDIVEQERRGSE